MATVRLIARCRPAAVPGRRHLRPLCDIACTASRRANRAAAQVCEDPTRSVSVAPGRTPRWPDRHPAVAMTVTGTLTASEPPCCSQALLSQEIRSTAAAVHGPDGSGPAGLRGQLSQTINFTGGVLGTFTPPRDEASRDEGRGARPCSARFPCAAADSLSLHRHGDWSTGTVTVWTCSTRGSWSVGMSCRCRLTGSVRAASGGTDDHDRAVLRPVGVW